MERRIYKSRGIQGITQGSIISGIRLERYEDKPVWGLIITPRCDLARGISVETVHFLPLVDFDTWFDREGKYILVNKYKFNLREKINDKLPKDIFSGDVFESGFSNQELKELIEGLDNCTNKQNLIQWLDMLGKRDVELFGAAHTSKNFESFAKNLSNDGEKRYYAIEDWEKEGDVKIILLREIFSLGRELALRYKDGFTEKEYSKNVLVANNLSTTKKRTGVYEIVKEVKSPYMEHIMQRFAYNFTRIGINDRPNTMQQIIRDKMK